MDRNFLSSIKAKTVDDGDDSVCTRRCQVLSQLQIQCPFRLHSSRRPCSVPFEECTSGHVSCPQRPTGRYLASPVSSVWTLRTCLRTVWLRLLLDKKRTVPLHRHTVEQCWLPFSLLCCLCRVAHVLCRCSAVVWAFPRRPVDGVCAPCQATWSTKRRLRQYV